MRTWLTQRKMPQDRSFRVMKDGRIRSYSPVPGDVYEAPTAGGWGYQPGGTYARILREFEAAANLPGSKPLTLDPAPVGRWAYVIVEKK